MLHLAALARTVVCEESKTRRSESEKKNKERGKKKKKTPARRRTASRELTTFSIPGVSRLWMRALSRTSTVTFRCLPNCFVTGATSGAVCAVSARFYATAPQQPQQAFRRYAAAAAPKMTASFAPWIVLGTSRRGCGQQSSAAVEAAMPLHFSEAAEQETTLDLEEKSPQSGESVVSGAVAAAATASAVASAQQATTAGKKTVEAHAKGHGFRALLRRYGLAFAIYVFVVDEILCLLFACCLHYNWVGTGDVSSLLKMLRIDRWVNVDGALDKSLHLGPFELSARFATNYGVATVLSTALVPLQMAFCLATLPKLMRGGATLRAAIRPRKVAEVPL